MGTASTSATAWKGWQGIVRPLVRMSFSPCSVFLALLLINAVARPYSGLIHDARLYAVQVLDRVNPGLYSEDLYLSYGSQDKFSLFSTILGPAVERFGLKPAFFVCYLLANALLLFSAQRFVFSVIRQRTTAAMAMVYLAVNPITFGGLDVFHVNETFLTARLPAIAVVLLGLEQLVYDRRFRSFVLLVVALLIHPVMAFGGLLVWAYTVLAAILSTRRIVAIGTACLLVLSSILLYFPVGSALLGHMDETWREYVHAANYYATPSQWLLQDWLRIATALAITVSARRLLNFSQPVRRLLDGVLVVAVLGIVGSVLAQYLPYALPLQGQPYRALWLLQFIQIPLGISLIRYAWSRGEVRHRRWGVLMAGAFAVGTMTMLQILSAAGVLFVLGMRSSRSSKPGLGITAVLITACVVPLCIPVIANLHRVMSTPSPLDLWRFVPPTVGPLYTLLGALLLLAGMLRWSRGASRFCTLALTSSLALHVAFFVAPSLPLWGGNLSSHATEVATLRQFLGERYGAADRLPTVYWPQASLADIWINLPATCYFTKQQTAGNMFNRDTAIEGQRRANLVGSFELAEFEYRCPGRQWFRKSMRDVFRHHMGRGDPTLDDLYALCDEDIDVVITRQEFDGLYSMKVGPLYVYECAKIRETLRQSLSKADGQETKPVTVQF